MFIRLTQKQDMNPIYLNINAIDAIQLGTCNGTTGTIIDYDGRRVVVNEPVMSVISMLEGLQEIDDELQEEQTAMERYVELLESKIRGGSVDRAKRLTLAEIEELILAVNKSHFGDGPGIE